MSYPDTLKQILRIRFDVEVEDEARLEAKHEEYFGSAEFYSRARAYFRERLSFLLNQISDGEPVFATNLFHASIGFMLTGGELRSESDRIVEYILNLRSEGGFLAIEKDFVARFPKLHSAQKSPMVPEIYSSFYAYFLLTAIGKNFGSSELENLISWVLAHQKPSGVIYNSEYSNTPEARRFEAELTSQLYFATEMICWISPLLPDYDLGSAMTRAKEWVFDRWISLKTVAGRYFAIKTLHRIATEELVNLGSSEMIGFIQDRLSSENDGYYDYRLQDKIDEAMTSFSMTELDKISSHVFSTYYALTILKMLEKHCRCHAIINHADIKRLAAKAANSDSGFGMKVLIKDFEEPYGPTSTELETLLILLLPLLATEFH